jgi:hypothetical protein
MKQKMTDEHRKFLKDCLSMEIYYTYKYKKMRMAENFSEEELRVYHIAYVKLVHSFGNLSGEPLRNTIKVIVDSTKSATEKYNEYKKVIAENVVLYNKANELHKKKQIKL